MAQLSINAYIGFNGNCREALEFYAPILKAEPTIMTYAEALPNTSEGAAPDSFGDKIMHARLDFGEGAVLMMCDMMPDQKCTPGDNVSLIVHSSEVVEGMRIFSKLADGGKITMPFGEVFWGAQFGTLTDKYGVNWMVNCE